MLEILTYEKHLLGTVNQSEFDYGLFTNLPRLIFALSLHPFKLKRGILPSFTKLVS